MLTRVACLLEIIAIIIGFYRIYGAKLKIDISVASTILLLIFVQENIKILKLSYVGTTIYGIIFFIFCKYKFKASFVKTGVNIVCVNVMVVICQFVAAILTYFFVPDNKMLRAVCVNTVVLLFNLFILPKFGLEKIKNTIKFKNIYTIIVFLMIGGIALLILIQSKKYNGFRADSFVLLIPIIIMLIIVFRKWNISQKTIERMQSEKKSVMHLQERYEDLLCDVRMKQHEFKNHIAAIFSTHYTYKTYDQLVDAQKEYCDAIIQDNKYNNLLLIENKILAGFLYEKFKQVEDEQIYFTYKINSKLDNIDMPIFHIIEVLGILIDNAVESTKEIEYKEVHIEIKEDSNACYFCIRNPYTYISYSEIEKWFQLDYSSKGNGRGIGLFHVNSICEEWNCNVVCKNIKIEDRNWIQFTLILNKTDNQ